MKMLFAFFLIVMSTFGILVVVANIREAHKRKTDPEYRKLAEDRDREHDQVHRGHGGKP